MPQGGSVIVTGGASGIGLAVVEDLLNAGWRVVAADVVPESLEKAKAALAAHGDTVRFVKMDVTDADEVVRIVAEIDRDFGPLQGVVNSAGIAADIPALDTSPELFRKILDVNVVGSFMVAREAARAMKPRGAGSIVNIASVSGIRGNLGRTAYGSSKGAVVQLTQILAVEFASFGVRVNAVSPGPIDTPMVKALHTEEARGAWMRTVPLRRYAAPVEVAGPILFLLDPEKSSFVTGQNIAVDGGFAAGGLIGL